MEQGRQQVHHMIPASERENGKETTQRMDVAGYMRPDATTNERVQSTYMHQDATREEYMPQELSREAMVQHTIPKSIPQGTRWSHAQHTNPTFITQSTQNEQHALATSRPQYTTGQTWAQEKRATIAAMLNGMDEGGDK